MTALSALGPAAAAAKPGWWIDAPPASMPTTGWMPGSSWVTLPMSVLPSGSAASTSAGTGLRPEPDHLGAEHLGQPAVRGQFGVGRLRPRRSRSSQPVATAPAAKQPRILSSSARSDAASVARIVYCSSARPGMTLVA